MLKKHIHKHPDSTDVSKFIFVCLSILAVIFAIACNIDKIKEWF
jgi:hypothetical protein